MLSNVIKVQLKELLKARNKSLYALAKETGITYQQLHKINKSEVSAMSFDILEKLCENLNCTPNDLLAIKK
jgi:putative transcriptional regulator